MYSILSRGVCVQAFNIRTRTWNRTPAGTSLTKRRGKNAARRAGCRVTTVFLTARCGCVVRRVDFSTTQFLDSATDVTIPAQDLYCVSNRGQPLFFATEVAGGGGGGSVPSPMNSLTDPTALAALGSAVTTTHAGAAIMLAPDNWHVSTLKLYTGSAYVCIFRVLLQLDEVLLFVGDISGLWLTASSVRYRRDFNLYDAIEFYVRSPGESVTLPSASFFLATWNHNSHQVRLADFAQPTSDGWYHVVIPLPVRRDGC